MRPRSDGHLGTAPTVIGVDVGGTKVAAACFAEGQVDDPVVLATSHVSAEAVVDDIAGAVEAVAARCGGAEAVGVGVPSQVEASSGTILSSVNIPLAGVELAADLRARLGLPVFVDNDANCAALAEAELAAAGPPRYLVMYTLGTGVGGGVLIDGRIYRGATGLGAELGHVVVQADGPPCPGNCPNRGCIEAFCSGTALERDAAELARAKPDSRLGQLAAGGAEPSGRHVVEAARDGDRDSCALLERLGTWLGVGLAGAINTFEPERIVIGGGLSGAADLFLEAARREARARALPVIAERVEIEAAGAGPRAGIIGAALLAVHELTGRRTGETAGAAESTTSGGGRR